MNTLITCVSALCTLASIISAIKSAMYYKRVKQLTTYANTNIAFIESQKIISSLTEIVKLSNPTTLKRGTNLAKQLAVHGEKIKVSINIMREKLPAKDFDDVNNLLSTPEMQIEPYIDTFISGTVLSEGRIEIGNEFQTCQRAFYGIQQLLKLKIEDVERKLS